MEERTVAEIVAELESGEGDPTTVPLSSCADVAEALADAGALEPLVEMVSRALPRLVKKERFEDIEGMWLACCAAGALETDVMLKAGNRLAARGRQEQAEDHLVMLVDALVEAGRYDEALSAADEALEAVSSRQVAAAAAPALEALYPDAPNLAEVTPRLREGDAAAAPGEVATAERAVRYCPGTFVQWHDHTIARVASCDGLEASVRHPSGAEEVRRVDGHPPPRLLDAADHEMRRLYDFEGLKASWREDPTAVLPALLAAQGGFFTTTALGGLLVPDLVPEDRYDDLLAELRAFCTEGDPTRPSYDSRRRLFVAPGVVPPRPKRKSAARPKEKKEEPKLTKTIPVAPQPTETVQSLEQPRWVDLTAIPAIRALIGRVEGEVTELTRELNVDLPVRLEEARAHGDLRENAEYDAAKERLAFVQARVEQLRGRLGQLHELSRVRLAPGHITVMSRVTVADEATGEERQLRITPAELPTPEPGDVSAGTPYAKALLNREMGDIAVVKLPRRTERLEIVKVVDPDEAP